MGHSRSRHGSRRRDITTYERRLVIEEQEEQVIDYSEDRAICKRRYSSPSQAPDSPAYVEYCLYVGNLPYDVTEHDLYKLFSGYNIAGLRMPARRRNDRSRGSGFVDMKSLRDAQDAISSLSGIEFLGRKVTVMLSRSSFSTAAVRDDRDDEPLEKRVKRGSDWGMDLKNNTTQGSLYKDFDNQAFPRPRNLSLFHAPQYRESDNSASSLSTMLAQELAQVWSDEYAGPDTSQSKRTECLARLFLQLEVPESKLHEQISRTFMARAASHKHEILVPAEERSERMVDKLEQQQWDRLYARAYPASERRRSSGEGESHKNRSFGSVEWTDGRE